MEQHRFLALAPIRWLSFQNCEAHILEQRDTLTLHWDFLVLEDPSHANDHLRITLKNVLGELNELNTKFQARKPLFHLLKSKVQKLLRTLGSEFHEAFSILG